jgi:acyl-CoA synthetase (AMP-forming)/AMP-acid ligase II
VVDQVLTPPDLQVPERVNIAELLSSYASRQPDRAAVQVASGSAANFQLKGVCYAELDSQSNRIARGLRERGMQVGDRVCVFVRPGVQLIAITFGLLKAGAVPVLIDPGMGRKSLLDCVERMQPRGFVGIPLAHALRRVFKKAFRTVEWDITVGSRFPFGGTSLDGLLKSTADDKFLEDTKCNQEAAILFTSGSTGPAKGVTYTHGNFVAQVLALKQLYKFEDGEIDAACFPLFALFSPGLELSCVFPELDPSRPANCDPARVVEGLLRSNATSTFGSPAIWRRIVPWCLENNVKLPRLRRVLIAGAPVPPSLVKGFHRILSEDADIHTPYGATESLPVSSISGREILELHAEHGEHAMGTCVGKPAPGIDLELIRIEDGPLPKWSEELRSDPGAIGEICVRGAVVTHEYKFQQEASALSKIQAAEGFYHRIGDLGKLDAQGRIWFQGRKSHRLQTATGLVPPVPTELLYNLAPGVHRTALVGHGAAGAEEAVLIIECEPGRSPMGKDSRAKFLDRLREHVAGKQGIADVRHFLFHPCFPVDVRHNAKIRREELKRWAREQLQ